MAPRLGRPGGRGCAPGHRCRLTRVRPVSQASILIVCTGNICRSPFIQRVLDQALASHWGEGVIEVRSAGVRGLHQQPMEPHALERLRQRGLAAPGFHSRHIEEAHIDTADLVLTATREHRAAVLQLRPAALRRTLTLREFGGLATGLPPEDLPRTADPTVWLREVTPALWRRRGTSATGQIDIDDPYTRGEEAYDLMARQVDEVMPWVSWALTGVGHPGAAGAEGA